MNETRFIEVQDRRTREEQKKRELIETRRNQARLAVSMTQRQNEYKSIDLYGTNVQETYQIMERRRKAEKEMSSSQFITLKKKYDEDENNRIHRP